MARPLLVQTLEELRYQRDRTEALTKNSNLGKFDMNSRHLGSAVEVRTLDPFYDSEWDRLVVSNSNSNVFHRAAWAKVLCKTYGHQPICLYFCRGSEPLALIPIMEIASLFTGRRGVSMPFSDLCQPLVFDHCGQKLLTEKLLELGRERKWRYFELRGGRETLPSSAVAAEKYYGHKLDLTLGVEELFGRFESPTRRAIRKAEKSGLCVQAHRTREAMLNFYRLHVRTRRRHGLPPQPLSFFLNLHEEMIRADLGFVVLAKSGLKPVAAAIFLQSGQTGCYKFGASDERLQECRGNNLVMWEGIKRLVERDVKTLHWGRTSTDNIGLRRFKLSWGTQEEVIEYFRFAVRGDRWIRGRDNTAGFHTHLFRRFPLSFNRLLGALLYRHMD